MFVHNVRECFVPWENENHAFWTLRPAHAHTHTNTLSNTRQALNTRRNTSIEKLSGYLLSGLLQIGQMQVRRPAPRPPHHTHTHLANPPWTNRKCTTLDRDPVWQPCLDEAVHLEGLTECHLRVVHTQPSWPQILTPPGPIGNCNQFLFLFFTAGYYADDLATAVGL